jgi:hypothetical protein
LEHQSERPSPGREKQGALCHEEERAGVQASWVRALETLGVLAFTLLLSWAVMRTVILSSALPFEETLTLGALSFFLAWLLSDLLSGLIHFAGDRIGHSAWPILGPGFIAPFREHHSFPDAILSHGLCERIGSHAIGTIPFLAGALVVGDASAPVSVTGLHVGVAFFLVSLSFWVVLTGQIHVWAHQRVVPVWVRRAQRIGILLSPEQHACHHTGAHRSHYCITSGFWDRAVFGGLSGQSSPTENKPEPEWS